MACGVIVIVLVPSVLRVCSENPIDATTWPQVLVGGRILRDNVVHRRSRIGVPGGFGADWLGTAPKAIGWSRRNPADQTLLTYNQPGALSRSTAHTRLVV